MKHYIEADKIEALVAKWGSLADKSGISLELRESLASCEAILFCSKELIALLPGEEVPMPDRPTNDPRRIWKAHPLPAHRAESGTSAAREIWEEAARIAYEYYTPGNNERQFVASALANRFLELAAAAPTPPTREELAPHIFDILVSHDTNNEALDAILDLLQSKGVLR